MATKSFLKNIDVRDKHFGRSLVLALENARNKGKIKVEYSKPVKEPDRNTIKELFGK